MMPMGHSIHVSSPAFAGEVPSACEAEGGFLFVTKPLSVIAFRDATSPAKAGEERPFTRLLV
jgi:hypothetical protein